MVENAIEFCETTKRFSEVTASDHVSSSPGKGEILAPFGESGSGKTTLMNILFDTCFLSGGQIKVNGEVASIQSPKDVSRPGIGMIHQHLKLIPMFSAAENIILGEQSGKYDLRATEQKFSELAECYGFRLNPKQKVHELSVSEKQTVEIMRALCRGADILIPDEPTAMPTPQETECLSAVPWKMWEDGKSIPIITHKLTEALAPSDRVAVLRKGQYIGAVETVEVDMTPLTEMMVGEKVKLGIGRAAPLNGPRRLRLENATCVSTEGVPVLPGLSLTLQGGETPGIVGIAGNGQRGLLEATAGLVSYSGEICYGEDDGSEKNLKGMTPAAIEALGVRLVFVSEDRPGMGLVGNMDLADSVMLHSYRSDASSVTDRKKSKEQAEQIVEELSVVMPGTATPIGQLPGGNVQKVLVGREIFGSPKVVMAAYLVRGPDIHSPYMIYQLLNEQKKKGNAVICAGEDLDVLLGLYDRILVLQGGKSAGTLDAHTTSKEELGRRMMGGEESEV